MVVAQDTANRFVVTGALSGDGRGEKEASALAMSDGGKRAKATVDDFEFERGNEGRGENLALSLLG